MWWKHVGNPRTNAAGSRPKHSSTSVSELWANVLPYADDAEDKRPFGDSDVWLSRMRSLAHRSCRRPSQLARFKRPVASIYLAAGLSHRGLSFSGPGSVPASAPQAHSSPSGAWGLFFASFRSLPAIFPRWRRALERGATCRLSLSALCGRRAGQAQRHRKAIIQTKV